MEIPLSIMEFGLTDPPNLHSHQVLNAIFQDVNLYEDLGYHRIWLSEHFSPEYAWFSPESLLPLLAGFSERIKIGWCGVLLNYHNPLLVANNIRILSALFDNRIDLGIAAARIAKDYEKVLPKSEDSWSKQVNVLSGMVRGESTISDVKKVFVPPHGTEAPNLWYLATSPNHIQMAVDNKMNFALSLMHPSSNFTANIDTIKLFKEAWYKKYSTKPTAIILMSSLGTENKSEKSAFEKQFDIPGFNGLFGSFEYIGDQLHKIQGLFENDEFCIHNPLSSRERRIKSYKGIINSLN